MLRRLHKEQPASFAFTPANLEWAQAQITKYPEGRQASAIIPLFWRAHEQEGWLTRAAIEHVCNMLDMPFIRGLEVATFYFMFKLEPRGSIANIQICGTTSCMICGAEDLVAVCKELIADKPHTVSADGKFSWEEVECLGACTNAPMAQIGKDYYEDLTPETLRDIIARFSKGEVPVPGPQNGRYASEPLSGLTSLTEYEAGRAQYNASVQAAVDLGETVKRIDGTEVPILTPWLGKPDHADPDGPKTEGPKPSAGKPVDETGITVQEAQAKPKGRPQVDADNKANSASAKAEPAEVAKVAEPREMPKADLAAKQPGKPAAETAEQPEEGIKPTGIKAARDGKPDDLKKIEGIGPALEKLCNSMGVFHYDQIAAWGEAEIAWMDSNLKGFKGRVTRDKWVPQAKLIGEVGMEEFLIRAKTNDY